eukprot:CCRYP_004103-RA/>CCRYP_004103-RA protein AED:0.27 eAED:0.27 QI:1426/0/1/1/0/0/2/594/160
MVIASTSPFAKISRLAMLVEDGRGMKNRQPQQHQQQHGPSRNQAAYCLTFLCTPNPRRRPSTTTSSPPTTAPPSPPPTPPRRRTNRPTPTPTHPNAARRRHHAVLTCRTLLNCVVGLGPRRRRRTSIGIADIFRGDKFGNGTLIHGTNLWFGVFGVMAEA